MDNKITEEVHDLCSKWDEHLDDILAHKMSITDFTPLEDLDRLQYGYEHAVEIMQAFEHEMQEAFLVYEQTDTQLNEAYSHFTKADRYAFMEFYQRIFVACSVLDINARLR